MVWVIEHLQLLEHHIIWRLKLFAAKDIIVWWIYGQSVIIKQNF